MKVTFTINQWVKWVTTPVTHSIGPRRDLQETPMNLNILTLPKYIFLWMFPHITTSTQPFRDPNQPRFDISAARPDSQRAKCAELRRWFYPWRPWIWRHTADGSRRFKRLVKLEPLCQIQEGGPSTVSISLCTSPFTTRITTTTNSSKRGDITAAENP